MKIRQDLTSGGTIRFRPGMSPWQFGESDTSDLRVVNNV